MAHYKILKTLQLDGKDYKPGAEAELKLNEKLEADLIKKGVLRPKETKKPKAA